MATVPASLAPVYAPVLHKSLCIGVDENTLRFPPAVTDQQGRSKYTLAWRGVDQRRVAGVTPNPTRLRRESRGTRPRLPYDHRREAHSRCQSYLREGETSGTGSLARAVALYPAPQGRNKLIPLVCHPSPPLTVVDYPLAVLGVQIEQTEGGRRRRLRPVGLNANGVDREVDCFVGVSPSGHQGFALKSTQSTERLCGAQ